MHRTAVCNCTHTRESWRSACRHCLLWTTLVSCVPAPYKSEGAQPYKRCLLSTSVLDAYRHEHPGKLAQLLPVLHRIDKRSWTSICTHARASSHSACLFCLLLTNGPSCVGRAGTRLLALHPVDNRSRLHRRECPAITYMAMGFRPRSFPVGGMYVKGIGRLTKVKKNHSLLFSIAS